MTYTSSNVLGNGHQYKSVDTVDIYGCIFLRGLKSGYRAQNSNENLADIVIQIQI